MARGKYLQKGLEFASRHALLLLLFGICLCLGYYLPNIEKPFRRTIGCTLATVSASCILMGAANLFQRRSCYGWASPLVGMAALIGRCSYAVYLWHVTVIQLGEKHVYPVFERFGITGDLLWFVTVVCITALCCLMGIAFTFAVELPFLRFRDRVFPSRGRVTQITGAA
jgi:peptidoglycan/LPS O-acetylase OafA/YrhL